MDLREITFNYIGPKEHHYVPKQATHDSFGYDIRYVGYEDFYLSRKTQLLVPTGLRLARPLPSDLALTIWPRSSLFKRYGCIITNSIGLVDGLYKDEIFVSLAVVFSQSRAFIEPGTSIAQLVFLPVALPLVIVDNSGKQDAAMTREGFGSTDG